MAVNMREKYESLSLAVLRDIAKNRGIKSTSTMRKEAVIDAMLAEDEKAAAAERMKTQATETGKTVTDMEQLDSGQTVTGILEVMADGFGFIRSDNYLPGENDVYVSPAQIRRFGLKTGDILSGNTRIKTQSEKFSALLYVTTVNGYHPAAAAKRPNFEELTPIFPKDRTAGKQYGDADYGFDFADRKRSERDDRFSAESGKNNSFKRSCAFGTENRTGHAPSYITDR